MKEQNHDLQINPIIERLVAASPEDDVVQMVGYVGPSTNDTVRLYRDFSLTEYCEVPKNSVLHFSNDPDDKDGLVKLFVKANTEVIHVSTQHTTYRAGDLSCSDIPSALDQMRLPAWWVYYAILKGGGLSLMEDLCILQGCKYNKITRQCECPKSK